jgi:hypothetical protein
MLNTIWDQQRRKLNWIMPKLIAADAKRNSVESVYHQTLKCNIIVLMLLSQGYLSSLVPWYKQSY